MIQPVGFLIMLDRPCGGKNVGGSGHHQIRDDEIGHLLPYYFQGLFPGIGPEDAVVPTTRVAAPVLGHPQVIPGTACVRERHLTSPTSTFGLWSAQSPLDHLSRATTNP